jgi:hypothetical protein
MGSLPGLNSGMRMITEELVEQEEGIQQVDLLHQQFIPAGECSKYYPSITQWNRNMLWLSRFSNGFIAFPAFGLEHKTFNCDGIGIGIQFGHCLVFGNPAAVDFVRFDDLSSLVHKFQDDVFAKFANESVTPASTL